MGALAFLVSIASKMTGNGIECQTVDFVIAGASEAIQKYDHGK
jgi:hypothetical protein